jgi:hypothetical protein
MQTSPWARLIAVAMIAAAALVVTGGSPAAAATNTCSNPVLASNPNGWGSLDGAAAAAIRSANR